MRHSGQWKGKSYICGGSANVKQALYMPVLVPARFNPNLKVKYKKRVAAECPLKSLSPPSCEARRDRKRLAQGRPMLAAIQA